MNTAGIHNARTKSNPFRRIVVSANNEYLELSFGQLNEKVVKQMVSWSACLWTDRLMYTTAAERTWQAKILSIGS